MIAYVVDIILICGGIQTAFEHCQRLRERGYDAFIVANGGNLSEFNVPVYPMSKLEEFTDKDIIVSVWYPQVQMLEKYKGRKIQFSQDCLEDIPLIGQQVIEDCRIARRNPNWKLMAVSDYAGKWTGRDYTKIPNGINERFFEKHNLKRDIDVLLEGNNDLNKGIADALEIAKSLPNLKIGWMARELEVGDWESFTNFPREEIPKVYQRSKILIKCSKTEGFGLPHLEAMASGTLLLTYHSGGNTFCENMVNCYAGHKEYLKRMLEKSIKKIDKEIIKNAHNTAEEYRWDKSIDKLEKFYDTTSNNGQG
jgi:glycosyltransferase involved in cell wall biosynthesis